jgi:hypothetical protein
VARLITHGACDHQQRSRRTGRAIDIVLDCSTLLGIQSGERIVGCDWRDGKIGHNGRHGTL